MLVRLRQPFALRRAAFLQITVLAGCRNFRDTRLLFSGPSISCGSQHRAKGNSRCIDSSASDKSESSRSTSLAAFRRHRSRSTRPTLRDSPRSGLHILARPHLSTWCPAVKASTLPPLDTTKLQARSKSHASRAKQRPQRSQPSPQALRPRESHDA